jgi:hypothetical protein
MSEDRFEQEEPKDLGSDDSDEVEAHKKKALTDELKDSDEGSDDFELHKKKA